MRDEFEGAQVFTLRPAPGDARFGVSFKGGHNDEHHNHNDLGSYVVVQGTRSLLLDPGAEVYTKRTFSAHRYDSLVLASYGHAVPLVAGRMQSPGREFAASVLARDYTTDRDEVTLDLTKGYAVPELLSLKRTFTYVRGAKPLFTVQDSAFFNAPAAFGTALITISEVKRLADNRLVIYDTDAAVEVVIDAGGAKFKVHYEELADDLFNSKRKARRIGIDLLKPSLEPVITVRIRPATVPVKETAEVPVATKPEASRL